MKDCLIVGGGISGLTTAWFLRKAGMSVQVIEAAEQAGGTMKSLNKDGFMVETGPNSALLNNPHITELVEDLGLQSEYQEANDQAKRRYILQHGVMQELPGGPQSFLKTPIFSLAGKLRLMKEPFVGKVTEEETVAQFVTRRLGKEFLDWAIDPFVSGVYAGDPHKLSVRAATSKVYALERDFGSLIGGMIKKTLFNKHRGGAGPAGKMFSFKKGMGTFPAAIAEQLGEDWAGGSPVDSLEKSENGWVVSSGQQSWEGKRLILSLPAHQAAKLLQPFSDEASQILADIVYPHVASVALGYRREQVAHPLDGFGFLIPRGEKVTTLGSLWSSTLFPGRAPEGHVLMTSFIGGRQNPASSEMTDEQLADQVKADISKYLEINGEPAFVNVTRWQKAIPQYEIGYLQRLEKVDQLLSGMNDLHFRANWRDGISVGDCIRNGFELAKQLSGDKRNV